MSRRIKVRPLVPKKNSPLWRPLVPPAGSKRARPLVSYPKKGTAAKLTRPLVPIKEDKKPGSRWYETWQTRNKPTYDIITGEPLDCPKCSHRLQRQADVNGRTVWVCPICGYIHI